MKKIIYIFLLLSVFSCNLFNKQDNETIEPGYTKFELNLSTGSRTILPDFVGIDYRYSITFTGDTHIDPIEINESSKTITLPDGSWTIDVNCLDINNNIIASGSTNINLPENKEAHVSLSFTQNLQGSLYLNLDYTLPDGITIGSITSKLLVKETGHEIPLNVSGIESGLTIEKTNIPSGLYIFNIDFIDSLGNQLTPYSDVVHIYDNLETSDLIIISKNEFSSIPDSPLGLRALNISNGTKLLWLDNATNEVGFQIERKEGNGDFVLLAQINEYNVDSYVDSTTVDGNTYYYRIKCYNSLGESNYSNISEVITLTDPKVLYVSENGTGDGLSWHTALGDLQEAIDKAITYERVPEIWVSKGTYLPSGMPNIDLPLDSKYNHFTLREGIKIYGGFIGNEINRSERDPWRNPTVLSGDLNQDDTFSIDGNNLVNPNNSDNTETVFYMPGNLSITNASIDGFEISGGSAVSTSNNGIYIVAGGIDNEKNSIKVLNCLFTNNYASRGGAAVYSYYGEVIIENCIFYQNDSHDDEVLSSYNSIIKNSLFVENYCDAISSTGHLIVENTTFYDTNVAIKDTNSSNITVRNSILDTMSSRGRTIDLDGNDSVLKSSNNYFENLYGSQYRDIKSYLIERRIESRLSYLSWSKIKGLDDIWLTDDDGLILGYGSSGLDSGDIDLLSKDFNDIDNNGNFSENTPYDIRGNSRVNKNIDIGAYESSYIDTTPCDPATNLNVTNLNNALWVEWEYPDNNDILKVLITEENNLFDEVEIQYPETGSRISALYNGTQYDINIVIVDYSGNKSSVTSAVGTPQNNTVPEVENIKVLSSNKSISLLWDKPENIDLSHYEVSVYEPNAGRVITKVDKSKRALSIPDLENGKNYTVNIKVFDIYNSSSKGFDFSVKPANKVFVDGSIVNPGHGSSWSSAVKDLSFAMAYAGENTEIWVKEGTYYPQFNARDTMDSIFRNFYFTINNSNVKVYGGFSGDEINLNQRDFINNKTILSGDFNNNDIIRGEGALLTIENNYDNAKNVLIIYGGSWNPNYIDGFTITGGSNDSYGGGVYTTSSQLIIDNCIITGNSAKYGGGIALTSSSTVRNSVIDRNISSENGGGVYLNSSAKLINTVISNNKSTNGGGISASHTPKIFNTTIASNYSTEKGGGVYQLENNYSFNVYLYNSILWNNLAGSGHDEIYSNYSMKDYMYRVAIKDYPKSCYIDYGSDTNFTSELIFNEIKFKNLNNFEGEDGKWFTNDDGLQIIENSSSIDTGLFDKNISVSYFHEGEAVNNKYPFDILGNPRVQGKEQDLGAYESNFEDIIIPENVLTPNLKSNGTTVEVFWKDPVISDLKYITIKYKDEQGNDISIDVEKGFEKCTIENIPIENHSTIEIKTTDYAGNESAYIPVNINSGGIYVEFKLPQDENIDITQAHNKVVLLSDKVSISINTNYESYQWYLDGVKANSVTGFYEVDANTVGIGKHIITCIVELNGNYYSKNITFEVSNN